MNRKKENKPAYQKSSIELIVMEAESSLLTGSARMTSFTNGGVNSKRGGNAATVAGFDRTKVNTLR